MKKILILLILFTFGFTGYCDYVVNSASVSRGSSTDDYYFYETFTVSESGTYRVSFAFSQYTYISSGLPTGCWSSLRFGSFDSGNAGTFPGAKVDSSGYTGGGTFDSANFYIEGGTQVFCVVAMTSDKTGSTNFKLYKVATGTENDQDGDGIPDDQDDDDDGDGIPDVIDPDHPDYDPTQDPESPEYEPPEDPENPEDPEEPEDPNPEDPEFEFKDLSAWEQIVEKLSPNTDGSFASFSPTFSIPIEFETQSYNISLDFNNLPYGFASIVSVIKAFLRIFCKIVFSWVFVRSIYRFLNK